MTRLEAILEQMQQPETTLAESVKLYGVGHLIVRKHCVISRQFHIFLHKESLLHISRRRTALQRSLLQSKHL